MDTSHQIVLSWSLGLPPEADSRLCHNKHAMRRPTSTKPFIVHVLLTCNSALLWAEWNTRGTPAALVLKLKFIKFRQGALWQHLAMVTGARGTGSNSTVEQKIVYAMCQCPELWDFWPVGYRDLNKKAQRWRGTLSVPGVLKVIERCDFACLLLTNTF